MAFDDRWCSARLCDRLERVLRRLEGGGGGNDGSSESESEDEESE